MKVRELTHEEAVMLWKEGMRDLLIKDVWANSIPSWRARGILGRDVCPTKLCQYGVEIVEG